MAKNLEFQGLSEFQEKLLSVAQDEMPKEMKKVMTKAGNRAVTQVRRVARSTVNQKTGNYYKGIKRGKVFIDGEGKLVVRVLNKAPHGHLIEYGHRMVTHNGKEVGFVPGKHIVEKGVKKFDNAKEFETVLSKGLDDILIKKGL